MGRTKKRRKRKQQKQYLKILWLETTSLSLINIYLHIQRTQTRSNINAKISIPRHSIVQILKDKELTCVLASFPRFFNTTSVPMVTAGSSPIQILTLRLLNIAHSEIIIKSCWSLSQINRTYPFILYYFLIKSVLTLTYRPQKIFSNLLHAPWASRPILHFLFFLLLFFVLKRLHHMHKFLSLSCFHWKCVLCIFTYSIFYS